MQEAIAKRRAWLFQNGYAQPAQGENKSVQLRPDAFQELATEEWTDISERLAKKYGMPVAELPQGGSVDGRYQGVEHVHAGKLAVVVGEDGVFVSPVRQTPEMQSGTEINLQRTSERDTSVELGRERSLELDQGLSL